MVARSDSLFRAPHHLRGHGSIRVRGRGEICLRLKGSGRMWLRRGPEDTFHFEGNGLPRHLSGEQIVMSNARGEVTLSGKALDVEFADGPVYAVLVGDFEVTTEGLGEMRMASGRLMGWGMHRRTVRLEAAQRHRD